MKNFLLVLFAAILGGAITLGGARYLDHESPKTESTEIATETKFINHGSNTSGIDLSKIDFTEAAENTLPVVVHIKSRATVQQRQNPNGIPPGFFDFFGGRAPQQQPQERQGSGSGVIISADGFIATNNHVIADADELTVTLNDKRSYSARVIGTDPSTDIALIKIDDTDLPAINFSDSDDLKVGQWVVAVGNPFNLASTVTAGIVSAKGRSINILEDQFPIESFIQTDAAVNPGNSGGALVNLKGELIGINTAIASPTGTYAGYAFAVPSNIVAKVITDLKEYGVVQRGFIGAQIVGMNAEVAEQKGLDTKVGIYVQGFAENSAAQEAGIEAGDVIVAVNDNVTNTSPELLEMIGRYRPGDKLNITVLRDGEERDFAVTLKNKDGNTDVIEKSDIQDALAALGAELSTLDESIANRIGVRGGVQITNLQDGKLRSETNIREGFIILKVDGHPVYSAEDLAKILESKEGGVMLEGIYPNSNRVYYYAFGLS
ncbi:MAG: Do family serine endopeptidase [Saprospiraceae bacterium]